MRKLLLFIMFSILCLNVLGCSTNGVTIEDLNRIQDKISEYFTDNNEYTNLVGYGIDTENKVVVVTLIDNSEKQQEWFKKNVINSKYIKFEQGGPYTTSKITLGDKAIEIKQKDNCDNEIDEYYDFNVGKVYLVCLDEVMLTDLDVTNPLSEYFSKTFQTFDDAIESLTENMNIKGLIKDGGTTIYQKNNLTIIRCNTIDGNKDVYIGSKLETNYCK